MYSKDYRERAVNYKDEEHTFKELKEAFKIPATTYYDWKEKMENGYYENTKKVERKRLINREKLQEAVEANPDAYLRELAELFDCTPQAIFYALKKLGITYKKKHLPTPKSQKKNEKNLWKNCRKSQ